MLIRLQRKRYPLHPRLGRLRAVCNAVRRIAHYGLLFMRMCSAPAAAANGPTAERCFQQTLCVPSATRLSAWPVPPPMDERRQPFMRAAMPCCR